MRELDHQRHLVMKFIKKVLKFLGFIIAIPIVYTLVSLLLSAITVNDDTPQDHPENKQAIYLSTNGVHLDIILPLELMDESLLQDLVIENQEKYLAFGWGDEGFYLNTPTWGDLTFKTAFKAMFLKSTTLMHVTRHSQKRASWTSITISNEELNKLNAFILQSFYLDSEGRKVELPNTGYHNYDHFYKALGSYSSIKTCNSWANSGFKKSGLKAAFWTPFDFGLLNKHE